MFKKLFAKIKSFFFYDASTTAVTEPVEEYRQAIAVPPEVAYAKHAATPAKQKEKKVAAIGAAKKVEKPTTVSATVPQPDNNLATNVVLFSTLNDNHTTSIAAEHKTTVAPKVAPCAPATDSNVVTAAPCTPPSRSYSDDSSSSSRSSDYSSSYSSSSSDYSSSYDSSSSSSSSSSFD